MQKKLGAGESEVIHSSAQRFYLPGLDGLRAMACTAVVGYHLFPSLVRGGFLGVDVFFVLSGFLITGLLVKEYRGRGSISISSFWLRRIRRLLPAVILAGLVVTLIVGIISKDLTVGLGYQLDGLATFTYNWLEIWRGVSYFDLAQPQLFTNVWSLAVEQQFYLVWPMVVWLLLQLPAPTRLGVHKKYLVQNLIPGLVCLVLAASSALWMHHLIDPDTDFTRAHMGSDSHAFGLMLGAAAAFFLKSPLMPTTDTTNAVAAWGRGMLGWIGLGATLVLFGLVRDDQALTYPRYTLVVCFATLAIIQTFPRRVLRGRGPALALAQILDLKVLVWLGQRSYGIYLWHWPILVIIWFLFPAVPPALTAAAVVVLSVLAAAASFRWIETPMRTRGIIATLRQWRATLGQYSRPVIAAIAVFSLVVVAAVATILVSSPAQTSAQMQVTQGEKAKFLPSTSATSKTYSTEQDTASHADKIVPSRPKPKPEVIQPVGKNVTIIGDSVTLAAQPALQEVFPEAVVDGEVSRAVPVALSLIDQYQESGQLGHYVVLGLTTNSVVTEEQLQAILEVLEDRKLVLVTGFGPARADWIVPSNQVIRDFAIDHPLQVRVAEWDSIIAEHTEHLAADYVHPDVEGGSLYAGVVKAALHGFPGVSSVGEVVELSRIELPSGALMQ